MFENLYYIGFLEAQQFHMTYLFIFFTNIHWWAEPAKKAEKGLLVLSTFYVLHTLVVKNCTF